MPPAPATISRQNILSLYTQYLRAANSFASYNFRHYFVRRTRHKFREELPRVLGAEKSISGKTGYEPTTSDASEDTSTDTKLRQWYSDALDELQTLKRSSVTNSMYQAPALVVEGRGRMMATGGGGAGAEQATGGAGQPVNPSAEPNS